MTINTVRTVRTAITTAGFFLAGLVLASCSEASDDGSDGAFEPADPATQTEGFSADEVHALTDTVTVGDTLTISDAEIDTTGCDFTFPEDVTRDAVKFQVIATVENQTGEDISEALWASDFTFLDADGLTVKTTDIGSAEGPCSNDNATQFVDLGDGEKRRAAVTLEAPAGATKMTYSASTIPGAEPVTWDVEDAVAEMTVTPAGGGAAPQPSDAAVEAPAVESPAADGFESGGIVDGPVVPDPDIPGANQPLPGESSVWYDENGNVTGGMTVDEDGNATYY